MAEDTVKSVLQTLIERGSLKSDAKLAEIQQQLAGGATLYTTLAETGLVDDGVLAQVQAKVAGVPFVDLREKTIPREVLTIIPESSAREHMIVAYEKTGEVLRVAMADPGDRQMVEFVHKKVDLPVEVSQASVSAVREALNLYQQSLEAELSDVVSKELKNVVMTEGDLLKAADDLPIIRVTQAILKHAILQRASDIHIEPTETKVIIRYRIDGILHDMLILPRTVLSGLVARIKVLANLKIDEHRLPQDGRFKLESEEYKIAFRVSTLPVYDGEKVVMRLLDESGQSLGLDDLGLHEKLLKMLRRAIKRPNGMVLVTGPTGSGKTTTLYAAMKEVSTPEVNISTIEDPIEYRMLRVNQTQVKTKIGLTFANGLRSLVRQDPDVIMVGEIRDEETASLAVNAALTGHLVLSTLHTNSAAGALPRLRDMKIEAFLLASTLNLVMAQRLVRRLCEKCRKKEKFSAAVVKEMQEEFDMEAILAVLQREGVIKDGGGWSDVVMYKAEGCKRCRDGYKGRVGIYEVMEITPEIRAIIRPQTTSAELETAARKEQGMINMVEDGFIKVATGVTSLEEVLRVARE
ncbi:MAG: GspE/PulE family protein [bacterium]